MLKTTIKIGLISIIFSNCLNASSIEKTISSMSEELFKTLTNQNDTYNKRKSFNKEKNEENLNFESLIKRENANINKQSSLFIKRFINEKDCDKILYNDGLFTTCFNYDLKSALNGYTKLDGELVNKTNIEKRPEFYIDENIPYQYRTTNQDYLKSGFDKGHNIGSDASFDYSLKTQKATYVLTNIVPQYPNTNRKSYLNVENYERVVALSFGESEIMTFNFFKNNPERLGRSQLAIPVGFAKIIWNSKENFQRCFYIPNDDKVYDLKNLEVSCKQLVDKLQ